MMESEKLKIVYLATELGVGGGEGIASTLIEQWIKDGHDVEVVLTYTAGRTAERLSQAGVKVHALNLQRGPALLLGIGKLFGKILEIKPNVVVLNNQSVLIGLAWMLRFVIAKLRVFMVLHSNDNNESFVTRALYKIFVPLYTKMIVLSEIHAGYARDYLKISNNNLRIVQNGIAPEEPGGVAPLPVLPTDAFVAVSLGRLDPVKDLPTMFRAAKRVSEHHQNFHVLVAGDGEIRQALENEVQRLGLSERVHFLGAVYDAAKCALLRSAHVGFQSSKGIENFPISVLEYMRAGLPVVATKVGSVPLIVEDGKTGLLVPSEDDEAFAKAIEQLMEDKTMRQAMGQAGHSRQQERFTAEAMARGYIEVFSQPESTAREPKKI